MDAAVCGRADGRDDVVDGMQWRAAGKSARYSGELVAPEPLRAVRRHLPFSDSQWQFSAQNFCANWSRLQLVSIRDFVQTEQQ